MAEGVEGAGQGLIPTGIQETKVQDRRGPIKVLQDYLQKKGDEQKAKSENQIAKERIDQTTKRLTAMVNGQEWKKLENVSGDTHTSSYPGVGNLSSYKHLPWLNRYSGISGEYNGKAHSVWVTTRPQETSQYTAEANDGSWIAQIGYRGGNPRLASFEMSGEVYLGRQTGKVQLERTSLKPDEFEVCLGEVTFGEWRKATSVGISIVRWSEDPKTKAKIGPVGPIREVRVKVWGRKSKVPDIGNYVDMETLPIRVDGDFTEAVIPVELPEKLPVQVMIRRTPEGIAILGAGEGKPLSTVDNPNPETRLEKEMILIPYDFAQTEIAIRQYEEVVAQLQEAFRQYSTLPQLAPKPK